MVEEALKVYVMRCVEAASDLNSELFARITDFYSSYPHDFVSERSPQYVLQGMQSRGAVFIEDSITNEIVACSLLTPLGDDYSEITAVRVIKNGFGLQKRMLWYQTVSNQIFCPPNRMLFGVVEKSNHASIKSFVDSGYVQIQPNTDFLLDHGFKNLQSNISIMKFDEGHFHNTCRSLVDLFESPILSSKDGKELVLRVDGYLRTNRSCKALLEQQSRLD